MNLELNFSKQISDWTIEYIFKYFYVWFKEYYTEHNVIWFNNSTPNLPKDASAPNSPFFLTIKNLENKKYILVSYWDRLHDLFNDNWKSYGKLVQLISSSGQHHMDDINYKNLYESGNLTYFTYPMYKLSYERLADELRIPFNKKSDNTLLFRGSLYGHRKDLNQIQPNMITNNLLNSYDYFQELSNNKISLSLDGAGIICHRDIEILSTGSVLMRPLSFHKFHNPIIPDIHYVGFEKSNDPKEQINIILNKYNEIKNNINFLNEISKNGLNWYFENGTVNKNVEILKKIINLDLLK